MAKKSGNQTKIVKSLQKDKQRKTKCDRNGIDNCSIVSFVVLSLCAYLAYSVYASLVQVPEMPKVDLDTWWGPNDTSIGHDTSIRPYRIVFSDAMIADLRRRFDDYRRLKKTKSFEDAAWTYGVNSVAFEKFFNHWIFNYDFQKQEKYLNKYDHFKTNIQGLDIHYIHVKPTVQEDIRIVPILLLHGWPSSVRDFYDVIPLLTSVRPDQDYVFEVIVPSLPGYGFSDAAVIPGLSSFRIAIVMRNLMQRLGFNQYYIQAGDVGHLVASNLATIFPDEVLGYHTNMAAVLTNLNIVLWFLGNIWPSFIERDYADRMYPFDEKVLFYLEESGYFHLQSTKPDSIGVALNESPAGLAAYILEKYVVSLDPNNKYKEDGGLEGWNWDKILDNVMIYWTSGCITTTLRLYKERVQDKKEKITYLIPTKVPTWAMRLKHELFFFPEFMIRWKYSNLLGSTTLETGGHLAAFEKPQVLADDVWRAVNRFREFHNTKRLQ